jgi:hypothetical protein
MTENEYLVEIIIILNYSPSSERTLWILAVICRYKSRERLKASKILCHCTTVNSRAAQGAIQCSLVDIQRPIRIDVSR